MGGVRGTVLVAETDISHLYKFKSLAGNSAQHVQDIILLNRLYFSRPDEFNDPFDCLPTVSLEATDKEWHNYFNELFKRKAPHISRSQRMAQIKAAMQGPLRNRNSKEARDWFQEITAKSVNSAGVLSLSECCDHPLIWSHYADAHRGVCLRFQAADTNRFFGRAQKVIYQVERPKINLILDAPNYLSEKSLLTKADYWSYEREWRIVDPFNGPGIQVFPSAFLDQVILGAKVLDENRAKVEAWLNQRGGNVELTHASISDDSFRIIFS